MQDTVLHLCNSALLTVMPWSLRGWPPLLWQAGGPSPLEFHHLGTRVQVGGGPDSHLIGQTVWGGSSASGEAGMAWDWVQICNGVVAMADPMSLITNLRVVGGEGEVLTAWEASRYLNQIVHALPWQDEVERALQAPH